MKPDRDLVAFCQAEYGRLVGLLGFYCGNRDVAEELAQEVLARACRDWKKICTMDDPRAWVYRVAVNLVNSHFRRLAAERRAKNRLKVENDLREIRTVNDPSESVLVWRVIHTLPRRQRTALLARHYLNLSVAETSQLMDCPEGTVKTLTRKALQDIRRLLGHDASKETRDVV